LKKVSKVESLEELIVNQDERRKHEEEGQVSEVQEALYSYQNQIAQFQTKMHHEILQ